jgi:hypothetical protein
MLSATVPRMSWIPPGLLLLFAGVVALLPWRLGCAGRSRCRV